MEEEAASAFLMPLRTIFDAEVLQPSRPFANQEQFAEFRRVVNDIYWGMEPFVTPTATLENAGQQGPYANGAIVAIALREGFFDGQPFRARVRKIMPRGELPRGEQLLPLMPFGEQLLPAFDLERLRKDIVR